MSRTGFARCLACSAALAWTLGAAPTRGQDAEAKPKTEAPAKGEQKPANGGPDERELETLKNITERFFKFVEGGKAEDFAAAQRALVDSPFYSSHPPIDIEKIDRLFKEEKYEEALGTIHGSMPNALLNPLAHMVAARALEKLGKEDEAGFEGFLAKRCLDGLLTTGDGTEERPIRITHVADEYDLIGMHFRTKRENQALMRKDGKSFDRLDCEDGKSYWFDVSNSMEGLRRLLEGAKQDAGGDSKEKESPDKPKPPAEGDGC